ncbi:E3 ubiquitin-protein ligase EL5-like [Phragmites australis]|uniref:E3 ubiquitin-protein ligase EL5-like n=1 Tax=Phragmites australis TaxID=29695 RepID=UPI002D77E43E|nr:E3 ubiquitin-protein ligase EL5-like [Phragmites australis]
MSAEEGTCYRWCCDFVVAHGVFASGFVTAPVAVVHLVNHPHSSAAAFFAIFASFCTTISLILCCSFYAELKRPPWPRWLSAAPASGGQQQEDGGGQESTREGSVPHDLRHPDQPVMARGEMQAALAAERIPSYEHRDGAADCTVCLGEVEKGETVRRLPACQHVFHRECIDMWLHAHATCPVCRSSALPAPERPVDVVVNIGIVDRQSSPMIPAPPGIVFPGRPGPACGSGWAHA